MKVRDFMEREVQTIHEGDSLQNLASRFAETHHEGFAVVNNHDEIMGFVTKRDLLRVFLPHYLAQPELIDVIEEFGLLEIDRQTNRVNTDLFLIEDIMNYEVVTVPPDASLTRALLLMFANKVASLPVVRGKTLLGVITMSRIIGALFARPMADPS